MYIPFHIGQRGNEQAERATKEAITDNNNPSELYNPIKDLKHS